MEITPKTLEYKLPELLCEHFGSKAELVDYKIANQRQDYLVLLAELCCPKIKVVICSGYDLDAAGQKMLDAGANKFLLSHHDPPSHEIYILV